MKIPALFFSALLVLLRPAFCEEEFVFEAGPAQNTLVQLFTSDASAACNPALDWMSRQKGAEPDQSGLWSRFVPLALHVNHWDVPGYADAFAKNEFDEMLMEYQRSWKAEAVYAPTVVANGADWSGWARQQGPPSDRDKETGTLSVRGSVVYVSDGKYTVQFKPAQKLQDKELTLHACLLTFDLSSKPSEGRNRGRLLKHDFIALGCLSQDLPRGSSSPKTLIDLPLPKARTMKPPRYAMVFWVTKKGDLLPLQAVGGFLPEST